MNLSICNPFYEMENLLNRYNHVTTTTSNNWMPAVDISEDKQSFSIKAELPGIEKKDVHVDIEDGLLTIKGERKAEINDEKKHRIERSYGSFIRSFNLAKTVDIDKIEAYYKDGILSVNIPKPTTKNPKKIAVKVN